MDAKIIGVLKTVDNGFEDNKIISVNYVDPRYDTINRLEDLNPHILEEIKHFFQNYKVLQGIKVEVKNFESKEVALDILKECQERYKNN